MLYANNKGAGKPAHPRSLIRDFPVCCLDNVITESLLGAHAILLVLSWGGSFAFLKVIYSSCFLGFISQIGQSITKWRRSTDGKTNTSNLSQGSNLSIASRDRCGEPSSADDDYSQNVVIPQYAMSNITPVVRRSKSTVTGSHGPFSASKKFVLIDFLLHFSLLLVRCSWVYGFFFLSFYFSFTVRPFTG